VGGRASLFTFLSKKSYSQADLRLPGISPKNELPLEEPRWDRLS
jgi:hypothetical protein